MKNIAKQRHIIRFKRFSRKGYAVFASLNKEITIGRISIPMCNSAYNKETKKLSLLYPTSQAENILTNTLPDLDDISNRTLLVEQLIEFSFIEATSTAASFFLALNYYNPKSPDNYLFGDFFIFNNLYSKHS